MASVGFLLDLFVLFIINIWYIIAQTVLHKSVINNTCNITEKCNINSTEVCIGRVPVVVETQKSLYRMAGSFGFADVTCLYLQAI